MKITFNINFHTVWGQKLCVVGSVPELGSWEPVLAKEMCYSGDGNWRLELELQSDVRQLEYRYFLCINDNRIFEEWEKNHRVRFDGQSESYVLYDYWQIPPDDLAFCSSAFTKGLFAHSNDMRGHSVESEKRLLIKVLAPRVEKGQYVAISGNQECLGNWCPENALPLNCDAAPEWSIMLDATLIHYPLEYKFLVRDAQSHRLLYWESEENRTLRLDSQGAGETIVISGLHFRENLPLWRCAGSVVPVFSLRSEDSFGVGDLGDLRKLVDWAHKTHQHIIQILPMNDTTMTHTWLDSYPYSAISIYALHPLYVDLSTLGSLRDPARAAFYEEKRQELNALECVDYECALRYKLGYCQEYFAQEGKRVLDTPEFKAFLSENESWLMPYATFCFLRESYGTADFSQWLGNSVYNRTRVRALCRPTSDAWGEISFTYFLQFVLHKQFKAVSDYARANEVVLKGDLPIGVSRTSVEAWTEPGYFNMDSQAGAPPDDFSVNGQNWHFPTYNWDAMEKDHFTWWKKRFAKLGDYFDCFRIDHILGFFRIWEIPTDYVQGLCGHFNPALPLSRKEIEQYGLTFDEHRFTIPRINERFLPELFKENMEEVIGTYLARSSSRHYVLKPFCDTQRKIEALFADKTDRASIRIKEGLLAITNEVLFMRDTKDPDKFHPRISASQSFIYRELSASERYAFDQLYWHFFYHRHNEFWKAQALKRLVPLVSSTEMLVCGEDLGMIPASVPEVMTKLQIFSLEIERMPKTSQQEFTDLRNLPYHSVCTTSTHDMNPLRSWWKEDPLKTRRYYNNVLGREGEAPEECSAEIATQIVLNHLNAKSMLTIIPLQDWFAMDDSIKRKDCEAERINVPADAHHYWRYRMHITLEKLMAADHLNQKICALIAESGRK